jgi:hypothetical protein
MLVIHDGSRRVLRGGFVVLTASTGFFTNNHLVDDLVVEQVCN